jgi:alpha-tubulin suppressor-like RCC1 family protein
MRRPEVRKGALVLLGVTLALAGLTACGPLRVAGQRCNPRTETWAHDNQHWVLQCKPNGRWTRALTEAQANAFWAAVAAKQAAEKAAQNPPPPPPPPPTPVIAPSVPAIGSGARRIATGLNHSCAISGSLLKCWGSNISGQLGLGTNAGGAISTLTAVATQVTDASSVAAAKNTTCAVVTGGAVKCFGANEADQVGKAGGAGAYEAAPVQVPGLSGVVQVGVGDEHSCALKNNGTVWCWGDESLGKLGNGSAIGTTFNPVQVAGLSGIAQIAVGANHACALRTDGVVFCWGANSLGQLGNGRGGPDDKNAADQLAVLPTPVVAFGGTVLSTARSISAGGSDSCVTDPHGYVYCWGDNAFGEIGWGSPNGTQLFPPYTTVVGYPVSGLSHATSISIGAYHVCVTIDNGGVMCWGRNDSYQLGVATLGWFVIPQYAPGIGAAVGVSSSTVDTCSLRNDGHAFCWGVVGGNTLGNRLGTGGVAAGGHLPGAPVIGFP